MGRSINATSQRNDRDPLPQGYEHYRCVDYSARFGIGDAHLEGQVLPASFRRAGVSVALDDSFPGLLRQQAVRWLRQVSKALLDFKIQCSSSLVRSEPTGRSELRFLVLLRLFNAQDLVCGHVIEHLPGAGGPLNLDLVHFLGCA